MTLRLRTHRWLPLRRGAAGASPWRSSPAPLAIAATTALFADWRGSSQSVSASRLRVAPVTRGTLVRDATVNGRVVAAVSPTLYSPAPGTITLKVRRATP